MPQPVHRDTSLRLAYAGLGNFFDLFPLPMALQLAGDLFRAACSNRVWNKGCPADLLFFTGHLQELCSAAGCLYQHGAHTEIAAVSMPENGVPDMALTKHYVYPKYMLTVWDCMPRHLTAKQYHEPGRVLAKFAKLMPGEHLQSTLKELLGFALCKDSVEGAMPLPDLCKLQKRLLQLVEACHLVVVRMADEAN